MKRVGLISSDSPEQVKRPAPAKKPVAPAKKPVAPAKEAPKKDEE